jgi:hypothetical protein
LDPGRFESTKSLVTEGRFPQPISGCRIREIEVL